MSCIKSLFRADEVVKLGLSLLLLHEVCRLHPYVLRSDVGGEAQGGRSGLLL